MTHELFILFAGISIGTSLTLWVCNWLHWSDHREWCKLVDRQQAIIEQMIDKK